MLPNIMKLLCESDSTTDYTFEGIYLSDWIETMKLSMEDTLYNHSCAALFSCHFTNFRDLPPVIFQHYSFDDGSFFGQERIFERDPISLFERKYQTCIDSVSGVATFQREIMAEMTSGNNYIECLLNMLRYTHATLKPSTIGNGGVVNTYTTTPQEAQEAFSRQKKAVSLAPMRYSFILFYVYNLQMEHVVQKKVVDDEYMTIQYKNSDCAFESLLPRHYPTRSVNFNPTFDGVTHLDFKNGTWDDEAMSTSYLLSPEEKARYLVPNHGSIFGGNHDASDSGGNVQHLNPITEPFLGPLDTLMCLRHKPDGKLTMLSIPLLLTSAAQISWEHLSLEAIIALDESESSVCLNTPPGFICAYADDRYEDSKDLYSMYLSKRYLEQQLNDNYSQIGDIFCFYNVNLAHVVSYCVEDLEFKRPNPTSSDPYATTIDTYTPVSFVFNKKGVHFTADGIIANNFDHIVDNHQDCNVGTDKSELYQDWHYDDAHDLGPQRWDFHHQQFRHHYSQDNNANHWNHQENTQTSSTTAQHSIFRNYVSMGSDKQPKPALGTALIDPAKCYRVVSHLNTRTQKTTDHLLIKNPHVKFTACFYAKKSSRPLQPSGVHNSFPQSRDTTF